MMTKDNILEEIKVKIEKMKNEKDFSNKVKNKQEIFKKCGIDMPRAKVEDNIIAEQYPETAKQILEEVEKALKIIK